MTSWRSKQPITRQSPDWARQQEVTLYFRYLAIRTFEVPAQILGTELKRDRVNRAAVRGPVSRSLAAANCRPSTHTLCSLAQLISPQPAACAGVVEVRLTFKQGVGARPCITTDRATRRPACLTCVAGTCEVDISCHKDPSDKGEQGHGT